MQKWQEIRAKLCKSGPEPDAIGYSVAGEILQNHGEIKEQQSLTLTGTRWQSCGCCFLCSGGFGCLARAGVSSAAAAELLLRPLQVQGQAARPCCTPTPTRPAALFRAPSLPKKLGFSGRKFLPPGSISILHVGCGSIGYCAVWGPLSLSVSEISRQQASEELRPSRNFTESFSVAVKAE